MAPPIPKLRWSWKYERCVSCGTNKKYGREAHYIKGQCRGCYDRKRNREPLRIIKNKERRDKWKAKVKSNPELTQKFRDYHKNWRQNSTSYRVFFRKQKLKLRFQRFIKGWFENRGKKWQQRHQGIVITFEYGGMPYRIRTPLKQIIGKEFELALFEKELTKYLDRKFSTILSTVSELMTT